MVLAIAILPPYQLNGKRILYNIWLPEIAQFEAYNNANTDQYMGMLTNPYPIEP